ICPCLEDLLERNLGHGQTPRRPPTENYHSSGVYRYPSDRSCDPLDPEAQNYCLADKGHEDCQQDAYQINFTSSHQFDPSNLSTSNILQMKTKQVPIPRQLQIPFPHLLRYELYSRSI